MIKIVFLLCLLAVFLSLVFAAIRAAFLVSVSVKIQKNTTPYTQTLSQPETNILFLGDSTAFGTGAEQPALSVAGRLGQELPKASIENESRNGMKTKELLQNLRNRSWPERYSLIVLHIGGNDILRFTPQTELEVDINVLLAETKKHAEVVALITAGDVGRAPFFTYPLGKMWNKQTRAVREIFKKAAERHDVAYVDLLDADVDNLFEKDIPRYYSADRLHPRGAGYEVWYRQLRMELENTPFAEKLR